MDNASANVVVTVSFPPTQDERTMAVLAHALQLAGGFIGPLVILLFTASKQGTESGRDIPSLAVGRGGF